MPKCNECENYDKKNERCNLPVVVNTFDDECTEFSSDKMTNEEALAILDTIPTIGEQVDALEMAIEALQKELPDTWIIGREDGRLTYTHDTEDCLTTVNVHFPYCPYCGKKMKL